MAGWAAPFVRLFALASVVHANVFYASVCVPPCVFECVSVHFVCCISVCVCVLAISWPAFFCARCQGKSDTDRPGQTWGVHIVLAPISHILYIQYMSTLRTAQRSGRNKSRRILDVLVRARNNIKHFVRRPTATNRLRPHLLCRQHPKTRKAHVGTLQTIRVPFARCVRTKETRYVY